MLPLKTLAMFFYFLTNHGINTQDDSFQSKCPHLFLHEGRCTEPDIWYGIIVLMPPRNSLGVSFRLIFDRPTLQLGLNVVAKIPFRNYKEYLVELPSSSVKDNVPIIVRFYVKYNLTEPVPNLMVFKLNDRIICPEETISNDSPPKIELLRSTVYTNTTEYYINESEIRLYSPADQSSSPNKIDSGDECGTVLVRPKRFYYKQTTYEGEFPWHGAVLRKRKDGFSYACGATLISKYHAITVAHCITLKDSRIPVRPQNLRTYFGLYYLKRFRNSNIQGRDALKTMIHPQYNPITYNNNIAILKFITSVNITDYVKPVCLWDDLPDLSYVVGKQGSVVGWSFTEAGKTTEELAHAKMPIVSQETCLLSLPDYYIRYTANNTYCAGFRNGTSICNGDVGGAMVFPKLSSNQQRPRWYLRGLVSIAVASLVPESQLQCYPSRYAVFTDAAQHLDWIKKLIQ